MTSNLPVVWLRRIGRASWGMQPQEAYASLPPVFEDLQAEPGRPVCLKRLTGLLIVVAQHQVPGCLCRVGPQSFELKQQWMGEGRSVMHQVAQDHEGLYGIGRQEQL
jgi:hypothetical protein